MYNKVEDIYPFGHRLGGCLIKILGGTTIPIRAHVSDYEILSLIIEFATLIVIILTLYDKK